MDEQRNPQSLPEEPSLEEAAKRKPYEPPRIVQVENIRDLVAGGVGSQPDRRGRSDYT